MGIMRLLRGGLVSVLLACNPAPAGTVGQAEASTDDTITAPTQPTTANDTDDTIAATTQPTGANDTEVVPVADCTCVVEDLGTFGEPYLRFSFETCDWSPCGSIELGCDVGKPVEDPFCGDHKSPILDVEAVDCALDVLIAGTPAYLDYSETPDGGQFGTRGYVKIGEGRRALAMTEIREDHYMQFSAIEVLVLKPAEYFVGCKALADPRERYACLKAWTEGPALEVCAPPQTPL